MTDVADIRISASLIDDYLSIEQAPVAANLSGCFLAIDDAATRRPACLLTIDPSGNLLQFVAESSSHSGWSKTTVTVAPPENASGPINRLVGFSQNGVTNVLTYFPITGQPPNGGGCEWLQSSQPGSWTQMNLTNNAAVLGYTYQTDCYTDADGRQFVYGVSGSMGPPTFFIMALNSAGNDWNVLWEQSANQFSPQLSSGTAFRMLPGSAGNQFTIAWVDSGVLYYQGASISDCTFGWATGGPQSFNPGLGPFSASQIVPLPGVTQQGNLLIVDQDQTLMLFQGFDGPSPTSIPLTGVSPSGQPAGIVQATAGLNAAENLMVFVIEQHTQQLWILRQASPLDTQPNPFAPWVPLGNMLSAIACPMLSTSAAELYMVNLSQTVYHMAQTPSDQVWATRRVAAPAPSTTPPQRVGATTMELTIVDANGAPVGSTVVSVSSDQATTIIADNLSYQVAPGQPLDLPVDVTGHLTVLIQTQGLAAPVLTYTCTDADGTVLAHRWCQSDVVQDPQITPFPHSIANRLSNNDPTFPINQTTLAGANLLSPKYSDPTGAVKSVIACGEALKSNAQNPNGLDLSGITTPHWRIDFKDPAGPRFEVLTAGQARELLDQAGAAMDARALGDVGSWDSFSDDVVNFFKHAWKELEGVFASIANDVLHIIITGAEKIYRFIVKTIREAASTLEMIFSYIVEGLEDIYDAILDVIDFLKVLFDWDNILNTHKVIKWSINEFVSEIINSTTGDGGAQTWANNQIRTLKTEINSAIVKLEGQFEQSFNDYVNAANTAQNNPAGGSSNALGGQGAHAGYHQNAAQCNYVHSKAKSHAKSSTALATLWSALAPHDLTPNITAAVSKNWGSQTLSTAYTGKGSTPGNLFDAGIVKLLQACKEVIDDVLGGLQDIVAAVLEATGAALTGLSSGWTAVIDIPVISWLYANVITDGDQLTILDLFSLILAVPATIIYEVLRVGKKPFTADEVSSYCIPDFIPWPPFPSSSATPRSSMAAALPSKFTGTMAYCAGVADLMNMIVSTAADAEATAEVPDPVFNKFTSVVSLILSLASQVGGAPWAVFGKEYAEWSVADQWTLALWVCEFFRWLTKQCSRSRLGHWHGLPPK